MFFQQNIIQRRRNNIKQIFLLYLYAFCINAAYFFPTYFGYFVILWVPFFKSLAYRPSIHKVGSLTVLFSIHFLWLLNICIKQSDLCFHQILGLYGILIGIYLLHILCWIYTYKVFAQKTDNLFIQKALLTFCLTGYFMTVETWGGSVLTVPFGYPLMHPALPIANLFIHQKTDKSGITFKAVRPQNRTIPSFFSALEKKYVKKKRTTQCILASPETTIDINLHIHNEEIKPCYQLLDPNDILTIGSIIETSAGIEHALYLYTNNGCQGWFSKKQLIPFYEYIPPLFIHHPESFQIFLSKTTPFTPDRSNKENIICINNQKIQGYICADFFVKKISIHPDATLLIIVANDSSMLPYAAHLMKQYVLLKCFHLNVPVFYVGWQNSLKIF